MKLSKYLADYLEYEFDKIEDCGDMSHLFSQETVQEGIEAYMSTEDNKAIVINEDGKQVTIKLEE